MSEVTAPIMTDATGQSIDSKLNSLLGKMDNLAAAFQPNASGIVYSNTTSGLTGDNVQEAIDEMAADVTEIKQSLSNLIKTKSIGNVSTSTNGNITIADLNYDDVIPLAVSSNFVGVIATFGKASDGSLFIHFTNAAGQIYSGTMTSGTLYYMTRL